MNLYFFRLSGHKEINERLNDSMYEVLDVLSMYVFGRKPNHKNGEHTINFDLSNESIKDDCYQEAVKMMQEVIYVQFFTIFLYLFRILFYSYPIIYLKI